MKMLEYISAPEAAKRWGISERRVQKLCEENRIPGVAKFSRMWLIPKDAEKPADGRRKKRGDCGDTNCNMWRWPNRCISPREYNPKQFANLWYRLWNYHLYPEQQPTVWYCWGQLFLWFDFTGHWNARSVWHGNTRTDKTLFAECENYLCYFPYRVCDWRLWVIHFSLCSKRQSWKAVGAAISDAAKLIELEAGQEYTIQTNSRMEKIPFKEIFYIQRDGKNASIVSSSGVSKVRKSLQQVYDELGAQEFIFVDRGCIVNIIQVMKISDGMAVLKNGEQLPISRSHLQDVKQQINRFWGAHIWWSGTK